MKIVKSKSNSIVGFVLWLVWIAIVTIVIGGAIYLFVIGSTLFSEYNTEPLIVYREISDNDAVLLTGSILLPSACHSLHVSNEGDNLDQEIQFVFNKISDCDIDLRSGGVPETFFIQFDGNEDTKITTTVNSLKRELIIK